MGKLLSIDGAFLKKVFDFVLEGINDWKITGQMTTHQLNMGI